jgi:putative transposase
VLDEPYLMAAARYVERNPVRAKLTARAEDWLYSSASAHVGGRADVLAETDWLMDRTAGWVCTWGEHLAEPDAKELGTRLHRCETTGRPLRERPFLERLEALLGRELVKKKPGPRPKDKRRAWQRPR